MSFVHWPVRIKAFPFLGPFGSLKVVNYLKGKDPAAPENTEIVGRRVRACSRRGFGKRNRISRDKRQRRG